MEFGNRITAVIPQDPYTRGFLEVVDRQTKIDVFEKFEVDITRDWYCNTIANTVVETLLQAMSMDMAQDGAPKAFLNFYDLIIIRINTKREAKAEKEGNINVSFEAGPTATALIDSNVRKDQEQVEKIEPVKFFNIEDPDMDPDILKAMNDKYFNIDRKARYEMSRTYGFVMPDGASMCAFAVTYMFFLNIFKKLLYDLGEDPTKELVSVNFNDNIEIHALRKDGGVIFSMRPGYNTKLIVKSDNITEEVDTDVPWNI